MSTFYEPFILLTPPDSQPQVVALGRCHLVRKGQVWLISDVNNLNVDILTVGNLDVDKKPDGQVSSPNTQKIKYSCHIYKKMNFRWKWRFVFFPVKQKNSLFRQNLLTGSRFFFISHKRSPFRRQQKLVRESLSSPEITFPTWWYAIWRQKSAATD
jgi:hypothetical protein